MISTFDKQRFLQKKTNLIKYVVKSTDEPDTPLMES